ncbi:MAG: hypothetical protein IJ599_01930 [Alphaproteobacteria bacterium]|nr:hypothetical protein [Alphaproteobacteria bacterium]
MKNYKLLDKNSRSLYGFWSVRGNYLISASFDPWTGKYLLTSYRGDCVSIESCYPEIWRRGRDAINDAIRTIFIKNRRDAHHGYEVCDFLFDASCGYDKGMTRLSYIPAIRVYAFFRKSEKGVFDPMDYCPFCGAKFPQRLDGKLTEILRAEYGLQSWRDYKKAPHEFHPDEWWKKRGL